MTSADEIAEHALRLAHAAVDALASMSSGDSEALRQAELRVGAGRPSGEDSSTQRETWERHAALQLLVGAGCVKPGERQ